MMSVFLFQILFILQLILFCMGSRVLIVDSRPANRYGADFPPLTECYRTDLRKAVLETCTLGIEELANDLGYYTIISGGPLPDLFNLTSNDTSQFSESELAEVKTKSSQKMILELWRLWQTIPEEEKELFRGVLRDQRCSKTVIEYIDYFKAWNREVERRCHNAKDCLNAGVLNECRGLQGLKKGAILQRFKVKEELLNAGKILGQVCCCVGSRCNTAHSNLIFNKFIHISILLSTVILVKLF